MVGHAIDNNKANDQGYFKQIVNFTREVTQKVEGDADGDGRLTIAERCDTDGDGKISAAEYAAMSNLKYGDQHAAASVGATEAVRHGWAQLREARKTGQFVGTIADRVRTGADASMNYNARSGGWTSANRWAGPGSGSTAPGVGNRNVRTASSSNPFETRQTLADVAQEARRQQLKQYFQQQFTAGAGRGDAM